MAMGPRSSVVALDAGRHSALTGKFARSPRVPPYSFSILFASPENRTDNHPPEAPAFFVDLNCDQIVRAVTAGRDDYDLRPFCYDCVKHVDAIAYRHEMTRDLENESLRQRINAFAAKCATSANISVVQPKPTTLSKGRDGSWTQSIFTASRSIPWPIR